MPCHLPLTNVPLIRFVCIQWMDVMSYHIMSCQLTVQVEDWFYSHTPFTKGMLALHSFGRPNHYHNHHRRRRRKVRWWEDGDNCGGQGSIQHWMLLWRDHGHLPQKASSRSKSGFKTKSVSRSCETEESEDTDTKSVVPVMIIITTTTTNKVCLSIIIIHVSKWMEQEMIMMRQQQ